MIITSILLLLIIIILKNIKTKKYYEVKQWKTYLIIYCMEEMVSTN
jgi:hypothetical protein